MAADECAFLSSVCEVPEMNQYWYSVATIHAMVQEIEATFGSGQRVAFLSTPSIFFSLSEDSAARRNSHVFDYDRQWETSCERFHFFDFNDAARTLNADKDRCGDLCGSFDCCVVDPPFITRDVWSLYANAIRLLLNPTGERRVMLTTVGENEAMLRDVLGADIGGSLRKTRFMPAK